VKCYFSPQATETIISPTDVVLNEQQSFNAWSQYSNIDSGIGYIKFHHRDTNTTTTYTFHGKNGLWYHDSSGIICNDVAQNSSSIPTLRRLTNAALYELYHQRFGHPGQ
jgi:hypothetical protein